MRQLILFLATAAMVYLSSSTRVRDTIDMVSGQDVTKNTFILIMAIIAGLIIVFIDAFVPPAEEDIIEDFSGVEKRYSTNPTNQYVQFDRQEDTPFFQVPYDVGPKVQPSFDRFSKYFIGRNEGLVHKYSAAREAPENCIKAKTVGLETTAETVFRGKPLSYYQALAVNSGMPFYKGLNWKN